MAKLEKTMYRILAPAAVLPVVAGVRVHRQVINQLLRMLDLTEAMTAHTPSESESKGSS